ncbi:MAG: Gfo/Idh/MocA family oxidoreductase [Verrucomicrobia bacterium]|nr:Gfo/Idh/MocA family oxidoreductase [Verrucomicrobiota bacterium]
MITKSTRRDFLKTTALALGMPTIIPASALGKDGAVAPSNRIVVGGIGIGPRGREDLNAFLKQPDVQFVAIADVQADRRETVRRMANKQYGNEDCTKTRDMFEVLGRADIDAVLIATGDHWHALGIILAAKAGKDVYCEKPCSMPIRESQELADAVNRYGRVFQAGTQRRNVDNFRFAAELARSGRLGKIHTVHASILRLEESHVWLPAEPEPDIDVVDWDRWLGPAPWRPYNKSYVQGRWRGYYDFHGGAALPEWGAHTVDICQWAASADDTTPVEFEADGETIHARYASGVKLVMRLAGFRGEGNWVVPGTCPVRFEGDDGWIEAADSGKIAVSSPTLLTSSPPKEMAGTDPTQHIRNFLDCVKSRAKPAANADVTRRGHIVSHAAAIGWRLGRKVQFDPVTETFVNDAEANRMCSRARRAPWHA